MDLLAFCTVQTVVQGLFVLKKIPLYKGGSLTPPFGKGRLGGIYEIFF